MRLNVSPPSVASQRTVPPLPARGPALRDPVKLSARRTHTLTVKVRMWATDRGRKRGSET